jgi:hypothetical protein
MEYTLKIYRLDRRCKNGERFVGSYDYNRPNDAAMDREVNELRNSGYPSSQFRIEYAEKYITVKSLMSGKDVRIAADTPWSCRPDSESYWSM